MLMTSKQILRPTSLATPAPHPRVHRVPVGLANSVSPWKDRLDMSSLAMGERERVKKKKRT